ncbi:Carbonic anhydrase [Amanita muscaria]
MSATRLDRVFSQSLRYQRQIYRSSSILRAFRPPGLRVTSKGWTFLAMDGVRTCHTRSLDKDLENIYNGNQAFRDTMTQNHPGLLETLAKEQQPPFMMLCCADSRISEQVIFNTQLGTMFTTRNIANLFTEDDNAVSSVLAFSVGTVKVKHVVVMGHYGCAGVAGAMTPAPSPPLDTGADAIQKWISPVREVFATSKRSEIAAYREKLASHRDLSPITDFQHPAFRALVEENVKASVKRIANSAFIHNTYSKFPIQQIVTKAAADSAAEPVYIHGWVYDMEGGRVYDLGVSVGPPGVAVPKSPFPTTPAASDLDGA